MPGFSTHITEPCAELPVARAGKANVTAVIISGTFPSKLASLAIGPVRAFTYFYWCNIISFDASRWAWER